MSQAETCNHIMGGVREGRPHIMVCLHKGQGFKAETPGSTPSPISAVVCCFHEPRVHGMFAMNT